MLSLLSHPGVADWLLQNLAWAVLWAGVRACCQMFPALLAALPHLVVPRVFHVGQRPRDRVGMRADSQEGPGLSVSLHPDAWRQIARLGGHSTWALVRRDGRRGRFLDVTGLRRPSRDAARHALVAAGMLAVAPRFVVRAFDDELDTHLESLYSTLPEALDEAFLAPADLLARPRRLTSGDLVLTKDVDGTSVRQRLVPVPTDALRAWFGAHFTSRLSDVSAFDMALAWAVATHTALDGLWWRETLDPDRYSAPRGVITPRAQVLWCASARTPDDDAGDGFTLRRGRIPVAGSREPVEVPL